MEERQKQMNDMKHRNRPNSPTRAGHRSLGGGPSGLFHSPKERKKEKERESYEQSLAGA